MRKASKKVEDSLTTAKKVHRSRCRYIRGQIDGLQKYMAEERNRTTPDWTHVGNLGYVIEQLGGITYFLRIDRKGTKPLQSKRSHSNGS